MFDAEQSEAPRSESRRPFIVLVEARRFRGLQEEQVVTVDELVAFQVSLGEQLIPGVAGGQVIAGYRAADAGVKFIDVFAAGQVHHDQPAERLERPPEISQCGPLVAKVGEMVR